MKAVSWQMVIREILILTFKYPLGDQAIMPDTDLAFLWTTDSSKSPRTAGPDDGTAACAMDHR